MAELMGVLRRLSDVVSIRESLMGRGHDVKGVNGMCDLSLVCYSRGGSLACVPAPSLHVAGDG